MKPGSRFRISLLTSILVLALSSLAIAQEDYQVLKKFSATEGGGWGATAMVRAADGNFYGATSSLGPGGGVYRLTPAGVYTLIATTAVPMYWRDLLLASNGELYVVAESLSAFPTSTVFRIALDGTTTIVREGGWYRHLVEGAGGYLYGTSINDGEFGMGTAFRISLDGAFTTLRSLSAADGVGCCPRLISGTDGYFYGASSAGNIVRMDTAGMFTTVHAFSGDGPEGQGAGGELVEATDGNFYGTTGFGGAHGAGTLFRLGPNGSVTVVHAFSGPNVGPFSRSLMQGSDGHLYGSGFYGIYRVTLAGEYRLLHSSATLAAIERYGFGISALVEGPDHMLYGAAAYGPRSTAPGSAVDPGTLFRLNLQRSACANVMDLRNGIVKGALKSELPAYLGAFVVSTTEVTTLWSGVYPAITPTAVFEFPLINGDVVGLYSLVITADGNVCADWTTPEQN